MTAVGAGTPSAVRMLVDLLSSYGLPRLGADELIEALAKAQRPYIDFEIEVGSAFISHPFVNSRQDGPILFESATHRFGELS